MRKTNLLVIIAVLISVFLSCGPNPDRARIHLENGIELLYMAQTKSALEEFEKTLKYDPKSYEALYYRGACKRDLQDMDGAFDDFQKSIDLNPNFAEPYFSIALIYEYRNDRDMACFYYLKAEELGKPNITDYTKWCK